MLKQLRKYPLIYGISTRHDKEADFLKNIGIAEFPLARLEQVHKGGIARVDSGDDLSSRISGCDGAVTRAKGIALSVRTADCLSIFFYDPVNNVAGIAHAGWQGTSASISRNMIEAMKSDFDSDPSEVIIGMGPAIRQCCYEVRSEFLTHFPDSTAKMAHKYYFDLAGENYGYACLSADRDNSRTSRLIPKIWDSLEE